MLANLAGLAVPFLLFMEDVVWQRLARYYVEEEATSRDYVVDSSGPRGGSRVFRALGKNPVLEFADRPSRRSGEKCYPPYGCFSTDYPWTSQRPLALHPEPPSVIRPVFCLYTRRNPKDCHPLKTNETSRLRESPFDPSHPVTLLTHGFLEHGRKRWLLEVAEELLKARDQNVVALSWLGGTGPPYNQAIANARLVGVMAAHFLLFLAREAGTRIEDVHVVGHSLGAHLVSHIGSSIKDLAKRKLGRITGIDPAGPLFENADPRVRLDPEDALFVDVIHTNGAPLATGGLGLSQPLGHVDFYPNSGTHMPGCKLTFEEALEMENGSVVDGMRLFVGCNHMRGIDYFIESINSLCPFLAFECSNYAEYTRGGCGSCGQRGEKCGRMGYHAKEAWKPDFYEGESRKFYLLTGRRHPYCRVTHKVTVVVADHQISDDHEDGVGRFYITLHGSRGSSSSSRLGDEELHFKPGQGFSFLIPSQEIGEIDEILLKWKHGGTNDNRRSLPQSKIIIDQVIVHTLEHNATASFCGRGSELASGEEVAMRRDDSRGCLEKPLPEESQSLRGPLRNLRLQRRITKLLRDTEPEILIFK